MKLSPVTLQGDVVRLEPLSSEHVEGLVAVGGDASIWRHMPDCSPAPEDIRRFVQSALALQANGSALPFATIDLSSGRPVGSTRFGNIVLEHKRVEIGWTWIAPPWQRTPLNTEAKYLMMRYAFEQLGCNRVELKTNALNEKSRAAILRIGAKEEGTLRQHMVNSDGTLRDTVYYSVIAPEWPDVSTRLLALLAKRKYPGS